MVYFLHTQSETRINNLLVQAGLKVVKETLELSGETLRVIFTEKSRINII